MRWLQSVATSLVPTKCQATMRWALLVTIFLATIAILVVVVKQSVRPVATVAAAKQAFQAGNLSEASELVDRLGRLNLADGERFTLFAIIGHMARAEGRVDDALAAYRRVPVEAFAPHVEAANARVDLCERLGRFTEAVDVLEQLLELDEANPAMRRKLANLYAMGGLPSRAWPHVRRLIACGSSDLDVLTAAADPRSVPFIPFDARKQIGHGDPLLLMGTIRLHLRQGLEDDAREYLERLRHANGFVAERYVFEGWVRYELGGPAELDHWAKTPPPDADAVEQITDYWYLTGLLSSHRSQHAAAVRCFLEALAIRPDYSPAVSALARSASAIDEYEIAKAAVERASLLDELAAAASPLEMEVGTCRDIEIAARTCQKLGRVSEAVGWRKYAASSERCQDAAWINEVASLAQEGTTQPWLRDDANFARRFDRERFPRPLFENETDASEKKRVVVSNSIAFRDDCTEVGLRYRGNRNPAAEHTMRFFTGTGVGVVDFDGDLLPDLFFSQNTEHSSELPNFESKHEATTSELFRNVSGSRFHSATKQSCAFAVGFGQGVAVGDVDGDGFPDIYIGNDGPNELLVNNGDGTFRSASDLVGDDRNVTWTSSVAVADLDADGFADLFDANYLTGADIRTRVCGNQERQLSCPPRAFTPAADSLRLGTGEFGGRPAFVPSTLDEPFRGNGLGVVVANLDGRPGLELFVANDVTPNHLFVRSQESWSDVATLRGLAYDAEGASQACMGVACSDVNHDGATDLFVTNFFGERNAFYVSDGAGFYSEAVDQYRLGADSFSLLGFGAQFLDADADGDDDLIVANGHIFDAGDGQTPYRMPPKLYEAQGERFTAVPARRAGEFFETPQLGRAAARIDWNKDRATDVVMTDLKAPASLLTNVSPQLGRVLRIRLVGTRSHRDAIGAVAEVSSGDVRVVRELVAGDGYFCSNERVLTFALPEDASRVSVEVRWPSGMIGEWTEIPAESDALLIEGSSNSRTVLLP